MSSEQIREARNERRTRSRIPNKTAWALQDILDECAAGRREWERANQVAERKLDIVLQLHLSRLRHALDAIERKASDALQGKYQD